MIRLISSIPLIAPRCYIHPWFILTESYIVLWPKYQWCTILAIAVEKGPKSAALCWNGSLGRQGRMQAFLSHQSTMHTAAAATSQKRVWCKLTVVLLLLLLLPTTCSRTNYLAVTIHQYLLPTKAGGGAHSSEGDWHWWYYTDVSIVVTQTECCDLWHSVNKMSERGKGVEYCSDEQD